MKKIILLAIGFAGFLAGCKNGGGANSNSPTGVLNAMKADGKAKDINALKKHLCKNNIALMESAMQLAASFSGKTVDELMKESLAKNESQYTGDDIKIGNENITGDKATVDIEDTKTKKISTIDFIKEGGEWKFCMDMAGKMKEGMKGMGGLNSDTSNMDMNKILDKAKDVMNDPNTKEMMNSPEVKEQMKKTMEALQDPKKMEEMKKMMESMQDPKKLEEFKKAMESLKNVKPQ